MTDWNGQEANRSVVVPAGYTVEYEAEPKRLYRVDGVECASVTQILDVLDKPALVWWGMKVGVDGMLELAKRNDFPEPGDLLALASWEHPGEKLLHELATDACVKKLTSNMLTVNHRKEAGGTRGASVHDALERWAVAGEIPDPRDYPPTEQGYVIGLLAFLGDVPTLTADGVELMVGSKEHLYGGRYDLKAHTTEEHCVVVKTYPKMPSKTTRIPAGMGIWDLKTSADIYSSHVLQLEAYEGASIECGYEPTDFRVVVHVSKDGRYQVRRSRVTHADFLAIKGAYDAHERAEQSIKVKRGK